MLVTLKPDLHVNPEDVSHVQLTSERIRGTLESKILTAIVFRSKPTVYVELDIDYVVAKLNDQCTYKDRWTDEVGNIPICIVHDNSSRHDETKGQHRPCLTIDPYPKMLNFPEGTPAEGPQNVKYYDAGKNVGPIARLFMRGH